MRGLSKYGSKAYGIVTVDGWFSLECSEFVSYGNTGVVVLDESSEYGNVSDKSL